MTFVNTILTQGETKLVMLWPGSDVVNEPPETLIGVSVARFSPLEVRYRRTPERSTDAVAAKSPGGHTEAIVSAMMTSAHIRARVTHCCQALIIRPFLSVGVVAVQGQAPLEVSLQRGGAGARLHFRNRDRVDADGWIISSGRWSAPFVNGFRDQRAIDEQPRYGRIVL